jgi:hypothetical protein
VQRQRGDEDEHVADDRGSDPPDDGTPKRSRLWAPILAAISARIVAQNNVSPRRVPGRHDARQTNIQSTTHACPKPTLLRARIATR